MQNLLAIAAATACVLLAQSPATAQAPYIDCPQGAVFQDVTPLLTSQNAPDALCGSPRDPNGSGPCDDGYYQLMAPPALWPEGIPFGSRVVPSLYFNVNGAISFDTPTNYLAPESFPSPGVELIAAHLTDVDLRDSELDGRNPGRMLLCQDLAAGRIIATWSEIGFYDRRFEGIGLNTYQVVLEKSDLVCTTATGETRTSLGIELRYVELGWYASNTNQGNALGLCDPGQAFGEGGFCQPARAGMNPSGQPATLLEGSGTRSINTSLLAGSEAPGVFRFLVHPADVASCSCPEGTEREGARCLSLSPSADAGDDLEAIEADDVVLDGIGSRDDRGRAFSFAWTQVAGPAVVLVDDTTETPSFVAPAGPATLTFEVEVCNTLALCDTDLVEVEVIGLPDIVVADQTVTVGAGVSLDASASTDPQSLELEFDWTQVAGTTVTLTGPTTPRPRFSAPETPGELVFQLFVCNSYGACGNTMARVDVNCRSGFEERSGLCEDLDECAATPSPCDPNASCENTPGAFTCTCDDGYTGDGVTCTDLDECQAETSPCDPNASCQNTPGAFTCNCDDGYFGNGLTCTHLDECQAESSPCDPNASCQNTPGAFTCTCDDGFVGNGLTCTDLDECQAETSPCDPNASCENTPGAFTCTCGDGYTGDGRTCTDIDECAAGICAQSATCTNTPGSYTCICPEGTTGDPRTGCLDDTATQADDDDGGCAGGATSSVWLLLALAPAFVRRRRWPLRA